MKGREHPPSNSVSYSPEFRQSREILDLAWDDLMESEYWHELAAKDIDPLVVSRLFDIAITAYRNREEESG